MNIAEDSDNWGKSGNMKIELGIRLLATSGAIGGAADLSNISTANLR
jgi:hypothetical protein